VFSDMHVSSDSSSKSGTAYPGGCSNTPLTAQEKALAFIFFDISSCVGALSCSDAVRRRPRNTEFLVCRPTQRSG